MTVTMSNYRAWYPLQHRQLLLLEHHLESLNLELLLFFIPNFVSNFQFPIYDSLIKKSLPIINKKFKLQNNLHFGNRNSRSMYFETILAFNKKSGIYNIDSLDNLCWLFGKIVKGSFSLVIKKRWISRFNRYSWYF